MAEKKYKSIKVELDVDEMISKKKEAEGWGNISEVLRDLFRTEEKVKNGELVMAVGISEMDASTSKAAANEMLDPDSRTPDTIQKETENFKEVKTDISKSETLVKSEMTTDKSGNPIQNYATLFQDIKKDREYAVKVIAYLEKHYPKDEVNTLRWIAGLPEEGRS